MVSDVAPTERSRAAIDSGDLRRLASLALDHLNELFQTRPETGELYRANLVAVALCQGGAEHFVRPGHGVKDLDAWAFFRRNPRRPFPYRWRGTKDFGPSKFGRHPEEGATFQGRRVDVLGRDIPIATDDDPVSAIRRYFGKAGQRVHAALRNDRLS